jgi:hypothetical protein
VNLIIKSIQSVGGRFLARDNCDKKLWHPTSSKITRLKISHALRDKNACDMPDTLLSSLKLRISNYSERKKEDIMDALTSTLLRVPLVVHDKSTNDCIESILNDEVKIFLRKLTPPSHCRKPDDFDEFSECSKYLTRIDKSRADTSHSIQIQENKSTLEYISIEKDEYAFSSHIHDR